MRRPAAAVVIVLLLGGAWIAYSELWRHGGGKPVAFRVLPNALGAVKLTAPTFQHFRKRLYFENYLATKLSRIPPLPPVDFTRDEVLLVAVGARSSTGYAVRIESVTNQRGRIVVRVREITPSLGDHVVARVTYPYTLATIPLSPKPVHYIWLGRP
jgi:hypothetical protein